MEVFTSIKSRMGIAFSDSYTTRQCLDTVAFLDFNLIINETMSKKRLRRYAPTIYFVVL